MSSTFLTEVTGAILAGGISRRMQGLEKGLAILGHRPLIAHVIQRLKPQTSNLIINANKHIPEYESFGYPVVKDEFPDHPGPLAGIATCLAFAKTRYVLFSPCDSPCLPVDLCHRLYNELSLQNADIACVHDGERLQPLFAIIEVKLLTSISRYLESGARKVDAWYQQHKLVECDFSDEAGKFVNINTELELQKASVPDKI